MRFAGKRVVALAGLMMGATGAVQGQSAAAPKWEFQIVTLDPGHFHAALVQKEMLPGVYPATHVFSPSPEDTREFMRRIYAFNKRAENPTHWEVTSSIGDDYLERAMHVLEHPFQIVLGEGLFKVPLTVPVIVVISGNNSRKAEYIERSVQAGFHVLADKPMIIRPEELPRLQKAFDEAPRKHVLLYDIMTERFEITTILQRELSRRKELFGVLQTGTTDDPAISKISVHNFSKVVSGAQLVRPQWFFDPEQQGAGIVDVMTHLVDLVQWEAFPDVALEPADAKVSSARRWTTPITLEQFGRVTGAQEFPGFLAPYVKDGVLHAPSNGEMNYTLKGIHARTSVTWEFEAPPGAGDTHYSVMRGTRGVLTIRQGAEQGYKPVLYVERDGAVPASKFEKALAAAVAEIAKTWPGIGVAPEGDRFVVAIPEKYHVGHEAHFTQVTQNFLGYLRAGKLPAWEVPNMLTKYATIMQAYQKSAEK